jgi:plasmid stabilization system protein ParE
MRWLTITSNKKVRELAERSFLAAKESFGLLLSLPEMGSARRFQKERLKRVRLFPIGAPFQKQLVVYRRVQEDVEIIRVLHSSPDLEAILGESNE